MKVIFLDIDGVLNHSGTDEQAPSGAEGVDPENLKALRRIVEETGANLVLTSTWKVEWSAYPEMCTPDGAYLVQVLAEEGLTIFSKTTDDVLHRGKGISDWLGCISAELGDLPDWVVLDDEVYIDYDQYPGMMARLVKTAFGGGGLTEELATRAIRILNGEVEEHEQEVT